MAEAKWTAKATVRDAMNTRDTHPNSQELWLSPRVVTTPTSRYIAAFTPADAAAPFLGQLAHLVDAQTFEALLQRRRERDGSTHHLTVVAPPEMELLGGSIDLPGLCAVTLLGLGSAQSDSSVAFYVVAESPDLARWRTAHHLAAKDFHITLGFNPHDIHDVPKGRHTLAR